MMNRRHFLRTLGQTALATGAMAAMPTTFTHHSVNAADTSGYKALVCVFLFGGMDTHDVIIPTDVNEYDSFARIRQSFLQTQGAARDRSALLQLSPRNAESLEGRNYGLAPEMPQLKNLFDQGKAAIMGNVGPLIQPTTKTDVLAGRAILPKRLFSHNDQQSTWQAGQPEGAQLGWGGLFADAIIAAGGNAQGEEFSTITTGEPGPFLTGNRASPYQISLDGSAQLFLTDELRDPDIDPSYRDFLVRFDRALRGDGFNGRNIIAGDVRRKISAGLGSNDSYNNAIEGASTLTTRFNDGPLSSQLQAVANTINIRQTLGAGRQIFFVGLGGFDTHSDQARNLPRLLGEVDGAIASFTAAMEEMGLGNQVTLFTASDFGRTLAVNGDGTDHGWGSHHFVVGGAVKGNRIYGTIPPATLDHDMDMGGGRLIPGLSVEQYASTLGRWFGLSTEELTIALPNLGNFDSSPDFMTRA